eukprot:8867970-Prorocentrum_lima.AAC.1
MDRPPCCAATALCGIGSMQWETGKWEPGRGGCNAVGWCGGVQCATCLLYTSPSPRDSTSS